MAKSRQDRAVRACFRLPRAITLAGQCVISNMKHISPPSQAGSQTTAWVIMVTNASASLTFYHRRWNNLFFLCSLFNQSSPPCLHRGNLPSVLLFYPLHLLSSLHFGHRSFLWVPECPHKGAGKLEGFLKFSNQFLSKLSIPSLKKEVNKSGVVLTYFQSSKLPKRYFIPWSLGSSLEILESTALKWDSQEQLELEATGFSKILKDEK